MEAQRNEELAQVNRVRRLGLTSNWRPHAGTSLATNVTAAVSRTPPATSNVTNMELRFELAQRVRLFGRGESARTGQLFLRYARTTVRALPFVASTLIDPAPAFTTTIRAFPPFRDARHQSTGAPGHLLEVNTPATVLPFGTSIITTSVRPL